MRFVIATLVAAPLAAVLIVLYWHNKGMTEGADFVLRVITASGVFSP